MEKLSTAIDFSQLDHALCEICPGDFKIHPASAIDKHYLVAHGGMEMRKCKSCKNMFHRTMFATNVCPKCRRNSGRRKKFRTAGERKKQMLSTGIEKNESIRTTHGAYR